jgi:hypothetical protein
VKPDDRSVQDYVEEFYQQVQPAAHYPLWLMGYKIKDIKKDELGDTIKVIHQLKDLRNFVKKQNV